MCCELDSMSELSVFVYIKSHLTLYVKSKAQKSPCCGTNTYESSPKSPSPSIGTCSSLFKTSRELRNRIYWSAVDSSAILSCVGGPVDEGFCSTPADSTVSSTTFESPLPFTISFPSVGCGRTDLESPSNAIESGLYFDPVGHLNNSRRFQEINEPSNENITDCSKYERRKLLVKLAETRNNFQIFNRFSQLCSFRESTGTLPSMVQYQILRTNITRTIWQTVRRITNEILGVKGFT
ncbi:hypothetical protein pdam_00008649 [Pocillopora damicornis]|uniref:Uncharacterized protein n=1 Tax=Pocillopora damicornis TaxID=46731 RepID=A0A3M6TJN7_POCDA|nr:hypothetical protein pdam_00008649 [Pocillopora damicornis]